MKLTEEQQDRIVGYLEAKGVSGCALCGARELTVGEDLFTVVQGRKSCMVRC